MEYKVERPSFEGWSPDFDWVAFADLGELPSSPAALVLPLLTDELLQNGETAGALYEAVAAATKRGVAVLAATPLGPRALYGVAVSGDEPWDLDVGCIVARADLAHLLESSCIARVRPSVAGGALYLTAIEARLARALEERSISFVPQAAIGKYCADFLVNERVVVECDGAGYHDPESDSRRDAELAELGFRTLRFSGSQIYRDAPGCAALVEDVMNRVPGPASPALSLTGSQCRAAAHESGPGRVAAPAGSGKTRVVEARVSRLLDSGVNPARICAISFTNKAVDEMRGRLPEADAAGTHFTTLHALASGVARNGRRAERRTLIESVKDPRSPSRWTVLKPLLAEDEYRFPRSNDHWTRAMGKYRSTFVVPDFAEFPEDRRPAPDRFLEVHNDYERELQRRKLTDFEGLVLDAVRALARDADFRMLQSGRFDHWVVDEYQDLPPGKLALIRLLSSPGRNLFVVGDDDQVIYGFAGATPSIFRQFADAFPDAGEYVLTENFRSPHEIVVRSRWLIERNSDRVEKPIHPVRSLDDIDRMNVVVDDEYPDRAAAFVQARIEEGVRPEDIALLFRLRDMAVPVESLLSELGIAHVPCSHKQFFERKLIRPLRSWLRVVAGEGSPDDYRETLSWPSKYLRKADLERLGLRGEDVAGALSEIEAWAKTLPKRNESSVAEYLALVRSASRQTRPAQILDVLDLRTVMKGEAAPPGDAAPIVLYDIFERFAEQFDSVRELEMWIREKAHDKDYVIGEGETVERMVRVEGKVSLGSIHQAKGLEFPAVAVLGPLDGLPDPRATTSSKVEEERRIAYVGVTRARERLLFCASRRFGPELSVRRDGLTWGQYRAGLREPPAPAVRMRCPESGCGAVYVGHSRSHCPRHPWRRLARLE